MILYNGASGGLGRYLEEPLRGGDAPWHSLTARLEDQRSLVAELAHLDPGEAVTFLHLAGRVSVPACEEDPDGAFATNVRLACATVDTVLTWASQRGAKSRVIYVSSGHVYAAQRHGIKVAEDASTGARSVYAKTKLAAEQEVQGVASSHGAPFLAARVFGLLAPRQASNYLLPGLILRAKTGHLEGVAGLDFTRDYLDARDVCENLLLLGAAPWPEASVIVNVCSGVAVTIRDLLRAVLQQIDPERADDAMHRVTPAPGRPGDVAWLVGDPGRFVRLTGELPQRIPLFTTVAAAIGNLK